MTSPDAPQVEFHPFVDQLPYTRLKEVFPGVGQERIWPFMEPEYGVAVEGQQRWEGSKDKLELDCTLLLNPSWAVMKILP